MISRAFGTLGAALLGTTLVASPVVGTSPGEYQVKAAFLYNFAKFVQWPTEAFPAEDSPFRVCVLGEDPFGRALDETIAGKAVRDHPVVTLRLQTAGEAPGCHILFVSESERRRLAWILDAVGAESMLTVADLENFAERGGIVSLVLDEQRVRFEINVEAAERANLRVSSQLLRLARRVWPDRAEAAP